MRGMQALGVAVELSPASVSSCIEQTRLGFMYAPYYHPVMKSVKSVRSALQVKQAAAGAALHAWIGLQSTPLEEPSMFLHDVS